MNLHGRPLEPKSSASANSAISACDIFSGHGFIRPMDTVQYYKAFFEFYQAIIFPSLCQVNVGNFFLFIFTVV